MSACIRDREERVTIITSEVDGVEEASTQTSVGCIFEIPDNIGIVDPDYDDSAIMAPLDNENLMCVRHFVQDESVVDLPHGCNRDAKDATVCAKSSFGGAGCFFIPPSGYSSDDDG